MGSLGASSILSPLYKRLKTQGDKIVHRHTQPHAGDNFLASMPLTLSYLALTKSTSSPSLEVSLKKLVLASTIVHSRFKKAS